MKRTTFLGLVALAVWASILCVGNAGPAPETCVVCYTGNGFQDSVSPSTGEIKAVFTFSAMDEGAYRFGQARAPGYLFLESPDTPDMPASGRSLPPGGVYTYATTGLRG